MVIFKEKASIVSEAFSILALVLSDESLASVGGSEIRRSRTGDDGNAKAAALKDGKDSLNEVGKFGFVVVETNLHSIDAGTMQTLELVSYLFRAADYLNVTAEDAVGRNMLEPALSVSAFVAAIVINDRFAIW
jgi:hypothetical protein